MQNHATAFRNGRSPLARFRGLVLAAVVASVGFMAVSDTAQAQNAATPAIGKITGRVDVEDLLDIIFGDFCIGK